jgi:hypothetical protein
MIQRCKKHDRMVHCASLRLYRLAVRSSLDPATGDHA